MVFSVKMLLTGTTELIDTVYSEEIWFPNWSSQTLTGSPSL